MLPNPSRGSWKQSGLMELHRTTSRSEALQTGDFLHVRYHEGCEPFGQKIFDVFIHYKCLDNNSPHCERASTGLLRLPHPTTNVKPGKRFGGISDRMVDILVDVEHGRCR